jgi:hypothetical protein
MAIESTCRTSLDAGSSEALRAVLARALERALPHGVGAASWNVGAVAERDQVADAEFFMFTIAAHAFRALVLLHFRLDAAMADWIRRALNLSREGADRERLYDYMGEVGNGFCGEVKREMHKAYPYLGMSTPHHLHPKSLATLAEHRFAFEGHAQAHHHEGLRIGASLYVCAYADVDFRAVRAEPQAEAATSTLEMF